MNILFLTEVSRKTGKLRFDRCLKIAQALKRENISSVFILDSDMPDEADEEVYTVFQWQTDRARLSEALKELSSAYGIDCIFVDTENSCEHLTDAFTA